MSARFALTLVPFFYTQAYHDSMLKLSIMTEKELAHIFGDLDAYIPLHEGKFPFWTWIELIFFFFIAWKKVSDCFPLFLSIDLLLKLREGTGPDGTVAQIGQIVIDWVCMVAYKHIIGLYFLTSVIFKDD